MFFSLRLDSSPRTSGRERYWDELGCSRTRLCSRGGRGGGKEGERCLQIDHDNLSMDISFHERSARTFEGSKRGKQRSVGSSIRRRAISLRRRGPLDRHIAFFSPRATLSAFDIANPDQITVSLYHRSRSLCFVGGCCVWVLFCCHFFHGGGVGGSCFEQALHTTYIRTDRHTGIQYRHTYIQQRQATEEDGAHLQ